MKPLADVRIVAIEQYGAGPFASMQLADLGADVVKIEDPTIGGDTARHVPPYAAEGSSLFSRASTATSARLASTYASPARAPCWRISSGTRTR